MVVAEIDARADTISSPLPVELTIQLDHRAAREIVAVHLHWRGSGSDELPFATVNPPAECDGR